MIDGIFVAIALLGSVVLLTIIGFCTVIGALVRRSSRKRCNACFDWVMASQRFCPNCGAKQPGWATTTPSVSPPPLPAPVPLADAPPPRPEPVDEPTAPAVSVTPPPREKEPVAPAAGDASARSWPEILIRSLLYVGVFGMVVAVLTFLYSLRQEIPSTVKFGMMVLFTAGIYGFGRLLWTRWDYERTGMAFILLAALLLPLNYYAAKVFQLVTFDHSLLEWGLALCLFSGVYLVVSLRVREVVMPYVATLTFAVGVALIVFHYNPPWLGWGGCALTAAVLFEAWRRFDRRFRIPVLVVGIGAGCVAALSYGQKLLMLVRPDLDWVRETTDLLSFGLYGICLSITLLAVARQFGRLHKAFGAPFLMTVNLLVIVADVIRTHGDRLNLTPLLFLVVGVLWGAESLLGVLHRRFPGPRGEPSVDVGWPWRVAEANVAFIATVVGLLNCLQFTLPGLLLPFDSGTAGGMALGLLLGAAFFLGRCPRYPDCLYFALTLVGALFWHWVMRATIESGMDRTDVWFAVWMAYGAACTLLGSRFRRPRRVYGVRAVAYGLFATVLTLLLYAGIQIADGSDHWGAVTFAMVLGSAYFAAVSFVQLPIGRAFCRYAAILFAHAALYAACEWQMASPMATGLAQMLLASASQYSSGLRAVGAWRRPLGATSWCLFIVIGGATLAAPLVDAGKDGLGVVVYAVAAAYFGGVAWRTRSAALVFPAIASAYGGIYLGCLQAGLTTWDLYDFGAVAAATSVIVLGLWLAIGRAHLAYWYAGGFEIAGWMALVSALIAATRDAWPVLVVPALALGLWARLCHRDGRWRAPFVTAACALTVACSYRGLASDVFPGHSGAVGLAMLLPALCLLLVAEAFRRRQLPASASALLVVAGVVAAYSAALTLSHSDMFGLLCFLSLTLLAGLAYFLNRQTWALWLSLALLQPTFYLAMAVAGASRSVMRPLFVGLGGAFVVGGSIAAARRRGAQWNPIVATGALMVLIGLAGSLWVADAWSVDGQLDTTILTFALAGAVYALAARLCAAPRLYALSAGLWIIAYYLLLHRFDLRAVSLYTVPPGALLTVSGIVQRLAREPPGGGGDGQIKLGMAVAFLPVIIRILRPGQTTAAMLAAVAAVAILALSTRLRVKWLFYTAIGALTLVIMIQVIHLVNLAELPRWVWIGSVSIVCIGIGFLNERRFKHVLKENIGDARERMQRFFLEWR